jgi:hypothetical protein
MTQIDQQFPKIKLTHVATSTSVEFDSYLESFSDNFNSQWESTDVFGRMDEIKNFKRTTRTIELGWTVISEDTASAKKNYENCSTLMAMLYPVYSSTSVTTSTSKPIDVDLTQEQEQISQIAVNAGISSDLLEVFNEEVSNILTSTQERIRGNGLSQINSINRQTSVMSSPPIFKINFANLIKNGNENQLYGTIEGFKYSPDLEMGFFIVGQGDEQMMYPKVVSLSFAFTVIHTSPLGWEFENDTYKLRNQNFPFFKRR